MASLSRLFGSLMIGAGTLLLLGVSLLWTYGEYQGWQAEQARREFLRTFPTPAAPAVRAVEEAATPPLPEEAVAPPIPDEEAPPPAPDVGPARPGTATAAPPWQTAPPPLRIAVPAIELDTKVVPAVVKDGAWEVPKFVAGYLEGTGRPAAEGGNVVLSGHLQSLTSGNVFARLGELEPGDRIALYTGSAVFDYTVTGARLVSPRAVDVTFPTDEPRVTLITCAGEWDPVARDYAQRLVVTGELLAVNGEPAD